MKRISNFTADRMDMQEMAAISGGFPAGPPTPTGGSTSVPTHGHPCGVDFFNSTWRDWCNGVAVYEYYRSSEFLEPECSVAANLNPSILNPELLCQIGAPGRLRP